jgi:methyl acetate hydrolase
LSAAERLEAALAQGMADAGLPGVVAAARLPGGETVEVALGARGASKAEPMTADTLFWIASCTKALTATAAMLAIEDGLIGLDDPAGAVLPALAAPRVLTGFDGAGEAALAPAANPITLRRLLNHTSGFAYPFTSEALERYAAATGQNQLSAAAPDFPLVFEPGRDWVYGIGIDWAGALIEAVTGETLDAYMHRRIFSPLGMGDTGFFPTDEQRARTASMHARTPDGGLVPIPFAMPPTHYFSMGGGGLYSTVGDYLKFMDSILGFAPQILRPESLAALCGVECEGREIGVLRTAQPHMSNDFDPFPGSVKTWGLGFVSNAEPGPHGRGRSSLAWAGLGNCYYWIDREAGAAGIMCAQLLPFADAGALATFAALERAVYAGI